MLNKLKLQVKGFMVRFKLRKVDLNKLKLTTDLDTIFQEESKKLNINPESYSYSIASGISSAQMYIKDILGLTYEGEQNQPAILLQKDLNTFTLLNVIIHELYHVKDILAGNLDLDVEDSSNLKDDMSKYLSLQYEVDAIDYQLSNIYRVLKLYTNIDELI